MSKSMKIIHLFSTAYTKSCKTQFKITHFKNKSNRAGANGVSTIQLHIHHIYTTSDDCFSQMIVDILYTAHNIQSSKLGDKKK